MILRTARYPLNDLLRSAGGWSEIKALRRIGETQKGDERILGSGLFVAGMLSDAELIQKYRLANLDRERMAFEILTKSCRKNDICIEALRGGSRLRKVSAVRRELVFRMTEELGLSFAEAARLLGVSTSAVAKIVERKNSNKSN